MVVEIELCATAAFYMMMKIYQLRVSLKEIKLPELPKNNRTLQQVWALNARNYNQDRHHYITFPHGTSKICAF
jgi:hypothetical protein